MHSLTMVQRLVHFITNGARRIYRGASERCNKKTFLAFISRFHIGRYYKNKGAQEQRDAIQPLHLRFNEYGVEVEQGGIVRMVIQKTQMNTAQGTGGDMPPDMRHIPLRGELVDAVIIMLAKYRGHYHLLDYEVLTHEQIEQVLDGVRDMIYQHEGILPPKK